jgi:hypothetical protein
MMREKISNYKQFAQLLLGNADSQFSSPFSGFTPPDKINYAMFLCFKRLFSRDMVKRESFAMRFFRSASHDYGHAVSQTPTRRPNLFQTSESGSQIFTDVGSSVNQEVAYGGQVGNIVNSANTSENVGLLFYEQGMAILDLEKVLSGSEQVSGSIAALNANNPAGIGRGRTIIGGPRSSYGQGGANPNAKFIPDLLVSASIDDITNHLASCRFSSGSNTAITFQNLTNINSTLIFCRATADEFNYSSNPTYVNSDTNEIRVIESQGAGGGKAFCFITTVGLYDASDNLLAVAKLSRPVEKNNEKDITIRVRLDF